MNCKKCGFLLAENDQFCKNCGEAVNSQNISDETSSVNTQVYSNSNTNTGNDVHSVNNQGYTSPNMNIQNDVHSVNNQGYTSPNMNIQNDVHSVNNQGYTNPNMNIQNDLQSMNNQGYTNPNMNTQNNAQPAWSNYNSNPVYNNRNNNKNSGIVKYIAIGFAVVVGIFVVLIIIGVLFGGNDDEINYNSGENTNSNISNTTTNRGNYKVSFKGFTLNVPDNYVYEEDDGVLLIGDEEGTWVTQIEIEQGSFSQLKANKNQLQAVMQQNGYVSSIANEKTLGGVEFITMEVSSGGQKAIAALAKANSMYFVGITAMNQDNEYDYKLLEKIAPIISSAQYYGTTNNIKSSTKLDMGGFAELAK